MPANRNGLPTPSQSGDDPFMCPVCGWVPCTRNCRLGFHRFELERLELLYPDFFAVDDYPEESSGAPEET